MDQEYDQPRDLDTDLAEITSRLGEPESLHRTNPGSVAWRFALGVLIVLAAAGLHYIMWTGQVPWPRARAWKLWIIILAGMFVGPGVGLYLITFAARGMKLWVLTYPMGLFIWHRGRVLAFPWDEVRAIQFSGLPDKAVLNRPIGPDGMAETVWYDLARSRRRVFGTTITLSRFDGEQASIPSTLVDFPDLGRRIQQETFRRIFTNLWTELREGGVLEFGGLKCDRDQISVGKKSIRWPEVDELKRAGDKLEIKQKGKKKLWGRCELSDLQNLHVLVGIAQAMRPSETVE